MQSKWKGKLNITFVGSAESSARVLYLLQNIIVNITMIRSLIRRSKLTIVGSAVEMLKCATQALKYKHPWKKLSLFTTVQLFASIIFMGIIIFIKIYEKM